MPVGRPSVVPYGMGTPRTDPKLRQIVRRWKALQAEQRKLAAQRRALRRRLGLRRAAMLARERRRIWNRIHNGLFCF